MEAGFTITKQGWHLLAKLLAGDKLEISKIMVGSGKVPEGVNPGEITELVRPVALATSTVPQVADKQVSFIVEYRNDLNGGLAEGFWLNEFGVYANDPDNGEILLYYATMGDYPQYVAAYNGQAVDVRRYPVVIALSECYNVELKPPAGAWVTFEELAETLKRRGYHSNLNLLINGDFRKPVNRNGKREYTGVGFTIDRVKIINGKVKVMDNYLEVTLNAQYSSLSFPLDCFDIRKTYTLSWLLELVTSGTVYTEIYANGLVGYNDISTQGINILTGGGVVNTKITAANLVNAGNTPVTLKVYAAKLELGSVQTLAHKDENGNWVLNDPPNYDLQYALCSQYSPITGKFVGSQHSNPNLLDNAYWADKDYIINQRGQNEYTAYGYSIDRYQIIAATLNINNNDITVSAPDDATNSHMVYLFENIPKAQTVTLSMLVDELNGHCYMTGFGKSLTLEPGLNVLTHTIPENYQNNSLYLLNYLQGTIKLKAAKLELGPVQTLAHKDENGNWILNDPPPSKALELAKCQRYQRVLSRGTIAQVVNSNNVVIKYPFDQPMRVAPVSVILNPQMKFLSAVEVLPPATNASVLSSDMTDKGVAYMHITGFNWSLPTNTVVALNDDNAVLLDANI